MIHQTTKILITGTAGFIGFHLAKRLLAEGFEVVGLDNINDYYDVNLKLGRLAETGIEIGTGHRAQGTGHRAEGKGQEMIQSSAYPNYRFVQMHLEDREGILELFAAERFDYVVHLAAQAGVRYSLTNPQAYMDANITGTLSILEACRAHPVKHLVYASSSSVYGKNTRMPFSVHHNVDHPVSLYAASKKANELMAHTYSHLFGIPTTGLRFFTVYGPWGRPDMALFLFTKAIVAGEPIDVFNHGDMMRDFTYVDDIIEGVTRVMKRPATPNPLWSGHEPNPGTSEAPYRIYNIGNSSPAKLLDFIKAIEEALGKKAIMNLMPIQPGDVPATWADTTDLERDLGYKPGTSIQEGVKRFVEWYVNYYSDRGLHG
jgi:UDP-glucuronate 4-epimerase